MTEDTILYDAVPENRNDRTEGDIGGVQGENQKAPADEKSKVNYLTIGGASALGLAGGVLGSHLAFSDSPVFETGGADSVADILVNDRLPIAQSVNDQMSFEEAFQAARDEVGLGGLFSWNGSHYGTYTQSEWNELTQAEQSEFWGSFSINPYHIEDNIEDNIQQNNHDSFAGHDFGNLAMAQSVNDSMSFGEAFAAARMEHGPNAVFEWKGNVYGTYYKEEWETMPQDTREQFSTAALRLSQGQHDQLAGSDAMYIKSDVPAEEELSFADDEVYEAEPDMDYFGQDHSVEYLHQPDPTGIEMIDLDFAPDFIQSVLPDALDIHEASAYPSSHFDAPVLTEDHLSNIEPFFDVNAAGSDNLKAMPLNITEDIGMGIEGMGDIFSEAFGIGSGMDDINKLIGGDLHGLDIDDSLF